MLTRDDWPDDGGQTSLLARNLVSEYAAIGVNVALGIAMLPFNLAHLGPSEYGLWVLTVSVTTYFSMLDLGYGASQVKFAAHYRALRDERALNEIASTLFFLFVGVAILAYGLSVVVSARLEGWFHLSPAQADTARWIFLIVGMQVALGFPFSVFGGLVNGFQRFYLNNVIAILSGAAVAAANVVVLLLGYGLVELVAVTTAIRVLSLLGYRWTAYQAFPALSIRWRHVSRLRLREVTAFSAYLFVIDIAVKVNMSSDTVVVGAFLGTSAVTVWAVASRFSKVTWTLTRVLGRFLFPTIVGSAAQDDVARMRMLYIEGTRLSLASVVAVALFSAIVAQPLLSAWVGPQFASSAPLVWLFAVIVILQIWAGAATSVLKGGGSHQLVAWTELAIAASNLVLSILLVRRFGLLGVAAGTLLPAAVGTVMVFFPAACRRVQLPIRQAMRQAVWPAMWPALPCGAALLLVTPRIRESLAITLLALAVTGVTYIAVFLFAAIEAGERRWYLERLKVLVRRRNLGAAA